MLWVVPVVVFSYLSFVQPWSVVKTALAPLGSVQIVVSFSYRGSFDDASPDAERTQMYVVLPASLRSLAAYEVTRDATGVRVQPIAFGLVIFGGVSVAWIGVSIWVWRRGPLWPYSGTTDL